MEEKEDFAKGYLLLHDILLALRFASTQIRAVGMITGMIPIYETHIDKAYLHFGTLVDFVNDPTKYREGDWKDNQLNTIELSVDRINHSVYSFDDVANAVQALDYKGDVNIFSDKDESGLITIRKRINLTAAGNDAINNRVYLREYLNQRKEDRTSKSTIDTNRWMVGLTIILAIGALVELIKFILEYVCNK